MPPDNTPDNRHDDQRALKELFKRAEDFADYALEHLTLEPVMPQCKRGQTDEQWYAWLVEYAMSFPPVYFEDLRLRYVILALFPNLNEADRAPLIGLRAARDAMKNPSPTSVPTAQSSEHPQGVLVASADAHQFAALCHRVIAEKGVEKKLTAVQMLALESDFFVLGSNIHSHARESSHP